ncbi:MAG: UDP-3-O-(3-hydroxymyristoyl)glucosamine N-acyltransferase [Alphaproteobacteria bacterium]|nr:UDP-3-O-(3-hydroxymyristoyl)glucosamine N-acyltransferase [Alphaproteobacteria bacterium]
MADLRFFDRAGPFSLEELARLAGAQLAPASDPVRQISDVAALDSALETEIVFLSERKLKDALAASKAGACILSPALADLAPPGMACLIHPDPKRAYALIAQAFYPQNAPDPWVAPTASVDPSAKLGQGVRIEPGAVIGRNAVLGDRVHVGANAVIGRSVVVGDDSRIGPLVSLQCCEIGKRVILHPGVAIGQDGYGFAPSRDGRHVKLPQMGLVIVSDDVEIGANTTIDRGATGDTVIGPHTKIDNLVQIGHNVRTGLGCGITAQVGISGSTTIGDLSLLYGQVGVADHSRIGSGVTILARSGVQGFVPDGATYMGYPAVEMREYLKIHKFLLRESRKMGSAKKSSESD